jgi:chromosome segregation ATPase
VTALRERVATVGDREATLRERAATLRGELSARRETGASTDDVAAELASVTGDLAAVETERIAAEQALRRGEAAAREARDARERRLRLEDRLANLRRAARHDLAERVAARVETVAARLPGPDGGPATTRLAAVTVGAVEAPVVLAVERFESALAARRALDAEVVRV